MIFRSQRVMDLLDPIEPLSPVVTPLVTRKRLVECSRATKSSGTREERRRVKNIRAAKSSRARKQAYIVLLKAQLSNLTEEHNMLNHDIIVLCAEQMIYIEQVNACRQLHRAL